MQMQICWCSLWVVREVSSLGNASDILASPMFTGKRDKVPEKELDKRLSGEKHGSDSDSLPNVEGSRDSRENSKPKRVALSELTGTMSRAAGRRITRIISFSKKKPPQPGDTRGPSLDEDPRCGYLSVLVNQCWKEQWCRVRCGSLHLYPEKDARRSPHTTVALRGCKVVPGLGPKHPFALRILRDGTEVAALEASGSEEMGRWLGVLLAESGSADPECLHYDYVDVETFANIRTAARNSFLWATSTESRTYDEVPYEETEQQNERLGNGYLLKRRSASSDRTMANPRITVKRHGSNTNQYGRYGKTRAEEDARRYLKEKEELEREKEQIRNVLVLLRKEKRETKEKIKVATDKQRLTLEKHVAQLEESCQKKESERVDLELKLTQVKDNIKKSLAGGALGAPVDVKPAGKTMRTEASYNESIIPVNCASEMRKRPLSIYASTKGNVMQKTKVTAYRPVKRLYILHKRCNSDTRSHFSTVNIVK
ncbi:Actin filament-associated protein 1-like 1 [Bagarius yarrelli]|uniref:Actin filament-associated protein 1-like 1 n=1 Tax=Bagarius yarrelli TaxID=175774 RepID=A0A556V0H3_BAGYA|nr:Actin filament-associated protein 1-like 1 [Bagarius yarrelli]